MTKKAATGKGRATTSPDPVTAYARAVLRKTRPIIAGPHVRDACARHLRDLKEGKKRGLTWDLAAALKKIGFFRDVLRLNGGGFEGDPFELLPWQAFVVGSLFGWKRANGSRRFRTAYIETAKGSGKTPMCAGIGLNMLCADGEMRAEVYAGAYNQDQAMLLFKNAIAMVQQSPELMQRLQISGIKKPHNIAYLRSGSFFRPISSERQGRGKSGPIPHCALLDELHEHVTNAMVEFLDAGKKHRQQPLTLMITNAGSGRQTVCWDYHQYAIDIAAGVAKGGKDDDAFFSYVCALDKGDDPFASEKSWIKANPSLPAVPGYEYIREQLQKARGMPSAEGLVRRLNFCQWTEAVDGWLSWDMWSPALAHLNLEDYAGMKCYGGLDASISSDLTALVLAFEVGPRQWDVFSWFWMPGDRLLELQLRDNMGSSYELWRDEGYLNAPAGSKVIDYAHIAQLLEQVCVKFDVQGIAYDRAKIELLRTELDKLGCEVPLVAHPQGFYRTPENSLWMPSSIAETEAALKDGRIKINENPVLNWNVASAQTVPSSINPEDVRFTKKKSSGRIDGAVALVQAIGAATTSVAPQRSVYETRGLISA